MAYVCCYKSVKIMWEYKEFTINTQEDGEPIKTLNQLGKDGWELCIYKITEKFWITSYEMIIIMKRKCAE